jgi:hypothetical protein
MKSYANPPLAILLALGLFGVSLGAAAQEAEPVLNKTAKADIDRMFGGKVDIVPTSRVATFKLVSRGSDPVFVTFNQCHNAAKESCSHGIESLDHEEKSGNCSFSCLAAPTSID